MTFKILIILAALLGYCNANSLRSQLKNKLTSQLLSAVGEQPNQQQCDINTTIHVQNLGYLCGVEANININKYLGIPYAKPFINFDPAELETSLISYYPQNSSIFPAVQYGDVCLQLDHNHQVIGSTNCLYLNVYVPKTALSSSSSLPVLVWIHGGEFLIGGGSVPTYDGTSLADQNNIIVVTINYRLGALGFLSIPKPGLFKEFIFRGNQGFLDQRLALSWVSSYIQAFGGDPSQVTVAGESAGAMSIGLHLFSSPQSYPLFKGAIMESNVLGLPYPDTTTIINTRWTQFMAAICNVTGIPSTDCNLNYSYLQQLSGLQIMKADTLYQMTNLVSNVEHHGLYMALPWTPIVDGEIIIDQPFRGYAKNIFIKPKPFILGFNRNESVLLIAPIYQMLQEKELKTQEQLAFGMMSAFYGIQGALKIDKTSVVMDGATTFFYNPSLAPPTTTFNNDTVASALNYIVNDQLFRCPNLIVAQSALVENNKSGLPIYAYAFTQGPAEGQQLENGLPACNDPELNNVCHTAEVPYVFDTLETIYPYGVPLKNAILSKYIGQLWGTFIKNGKFDNDIWTQFSGSNLKVLGDNQIEDDIFTSSSCALWKQQKPFSQK